MDIRESTQGDIETIESLYPEAFPDEDLLPVVRALLEDSAVGLSLVATTHSDVVAHVMPPYALPPEWDGAWQSQYLGDVARACAGKLSVPSEWQHRELWAPV